MVDLGWPYTGYPSHNTTRVICVFNAHQAFEKKQHDWKSDIDKFTQHDTKRHLAKEIVTDYCFHWELIGTKYMCRPKDTLTIEG